MTARLLSAALVLLVALAATSVAGAGERQGADKPRTYTLPAGATNPEGIAADTRNGRFYVTQRNGGAVYRGRVDRPGVTTFLPGGADGRTEATGIKVDERRNLLVIAGANTGAVFVYDLRTRALVNRIDLGGQFVNDVTVLRNGDVYATESMNVDPGVFRIPARTVRGGSGGDRFSAVPVSPPVAQAAGNNLNGIAASADGRVVLVVQGNTGRLFRLAIRTGRVTEVPVADGPLTNGDGLVLRGRTLHVVQNRDQRVTRVQLSRDLRSGRVLTSTTAPSFRDPTTAAFLRGDLLVANSQFFQMPAAAPFTVSRIPAP